MENVTCPERYAILPHYLFSDAHVHFQFKVAVATPLSNDIDVFADDVGFTATMDALTPPLEAKHGNKKTCS